MSIWKILLRNSCPPALLIFYDVASVQVKSFNKEYLLRHVPVFVANKLSQTTAEPKENEISLQVFRHSSYQIIDVLEEEIRSFSYTPSPAQLNTVIFDKPRELVKFSIVDEFVLSALGSWLQAAADPILTPSVYGFRAGYGDRALLKKVSSYLANTQPVWVVRRDISKFGESLSHEWVTKVAEEFFWTHPTIKYLIGVFSKFRISVGGKEIWNFKGLPTGSNFQLQISNLYLHKLDLLFYEQSDSLYSRLGDDILFISPDRERATLAASQIDQFISSVKLALNSSKSFDFKLSKDLPPGAHNPSDNVRSFFRFLGMDVFWDGEVRLPIDKWRIVLQTIRNLVKGAQVIPDKTLQFELSVKSISNLLNDSVINPKFHGYLRKIVSPRQLTELDNWIALYLGKAHFTNSFSKRNFKYSSRRKLRALGLSSCLHWARTHRSVFQD